MLKIPIYVLNNFEELVFHEKHVGDGIKQRTHGEKSTEDFTFSNVTFGLRKSKM